MAYLNYTDKALLLQRFRNKQNLVVEGNSLLFSDHSAEVSKKRKAFSKICTALYKKQEKFSLLYPAKLTLTSQTGCQLMFTDPAEAEAYLNNMEGEAASGGSPL